VPGAFACLWQGERVHVTELLVGLAVLVGLIGIVVPVLPGSLLILAAVVVWAAWVGTPTSWVVLAVAVTVLAAGAVVKYAVPGRRLSAGGVPRSTLVVGAALGVVGFFVIPVVGLVIGFVAGVYVAELRRLGSERAGRSTALALRAVGLSVLIELTAGLVAAMAWAAGVVLT
jgi:uncharacterized protein YqgC (DUF456 family)